MGCDTPLYWFPMKEGKGQDGSDWRLFLGFDWLLIGILLPTG